MLTKRDPCARIRPPDDPEAPIRRPATCPDPTLLLPLAGVACLLAARSLMDAPSGIACVAGLVLLAVWPAARLVRARRRKTLVPGRENRALLLASVVPTAMGVLVAGIVIRAPGTRPGSHPVEDIGFHPVMGHAPLPVPGIDPATTVGERRHVQDPTRDQVILLGDSVLYGWELPDEQTAARELDGRLPGLQVLNASVSGYSPEQYLLYLDEILGRPGVRPRFVVLGLYAGNDYHSARNSNWRGHSKPLYEMRDGRIALWRPVTPVWNCVDLFGGSLLMQPLWRFRDACEAFIDLACANRVLHEPEHEQVVRGILQAIRERTDRAGARLLVLLLPDRNDLDPRDTEYHRTLSRLDLLTRILKEEGLDSVFFADTLREPGRNIDDLFIEGDAAHYAPAGQRLLADVLEREIRRRMEDGPR